MRTFKIRHGPCRRPTSLYWQSTPWYRCTRHTYRFRKEPSISKWARTVAIVGLNSLFIFITSLTLPNLSHPLLNINFIAFFILSYLKLRIFFNLNERNFNLIFHQMFKIIVNTILNSWQVTFDLLRLWFMGYIKKMCKLIKFQRNSMIWLNRNFNNKIGSVYVKSIFRTSRFPQYQVPGPHQRRLIQRGWSSHWQSVHHRLEHMEKVYSQWSHCHHFFYLVALLRSPWIEQTLRVGMLPTQSQIKTYHLI